MEFFDREWRERFQITQHLTVAHGQTVEDAAGNLAVAFRNGLAGLGAITLNGGNHARRIGEAGVVGVDEETEGGLFRRVFVDGVHIARSFVFAVWVVGGLPFFAATLQQPHSTDVFQESGGSFNAAFVSEVVGVALFVDDGVAGLYAQQRPGAAAQVSETLVLSWNGGYGGTSVMTGYGYYGNRTQACLLLDFGCQHAYHV